MPKAALQDDAYHCVVIDDEGHWEVWPRAGDPFHPFLDGRWEGERDGPRWVEADCDNVRQCGYGRSTDVDGSVLVLDGTGVRRRLRHDFDYFRTRTLRCDGRGTSGEKHRHQCRHWN